MIPPIQRFLYMIGGQHMNTAACLPFAPGVVPPVSQRLLEHLACCGALSAR